MASSGYSDETTFNSVWNTTVVSARFTNLNVQIGGVLNFLISGDAATDTTETTVTPILRQISDELILRIMALSKVEKTVNPWDFLSVFSMSRIRREYALELQLIATTLGNTDVLEVVSISGLGANNDM